MSLALLVLKINTTFEDVHMILKWFFWYLDWFQIFKDQCGVFRPYLWVSLFNSIIRYRLNCFKKYNFLHYCTVHKKASLFKINRYLIIKISVETWRYVFQNMAKCVTSSLNTGITIKLSWFMPLGTLFSSQHFLKRWTFS